jgi:hypothetical protein
MATPDQIQKVLETLTLAYSTKNLDKLSLELYFKYLANIPGYILEVAVDQHIRASNWFPRIAELHNAAARIGGRDGLTNLEPKHSNNLNALAFELEKAFCREGIFNPEEWGALAERLEIHELAYFVCLVKCMAVRNTQA